MEELQDKYVRFDWAIKRLLYGAQYKMWHGQNVGRST